MVAETTPLGSERDEKLLNDTSDEGCQTTGTLGSALPEASSIRALSGAGKVVPGAPV